MSNTTLIIFIPKRKGKFMRQQKKEHRPVPGALKNRPDKLGRFLLLLVDIKIFIRKRIF